MLIHVRKKIVNINPDITSASCCVAENEMQILHAVVVDV